MFKTRRPREAFKQTSERRGGARMGFSERTDRIQSWAELNWTKWERELENFNTQG